VWGFGGGGVGGYRSPLFRPKYFRPGGFFKFVEVFGFLTICLFFKLFHILVALKMKKKLLLNKKYIKILLELPKKKHRSAVDFGIIGKLRC